jgi:hypothetical protein
MDDSGESAAAGKAFKPILQALTDAINALRWIAAGVFFVAAGVAGFLAWYLPHLTGKGASIIIANPAFTDDRDLRTVQRYGFRGRSDGDGHWRLTSRTSFTRSSDPVPKAAYGS